jgi:hypothetical protein
MRTVSDNYASPFSIDGNSSDEPIDGFLLNRIGDNLRHLYDGVIDSEMPRSLLELAETVDARRSERGGE